MYFLSFYTSCNWKRNKSYTPERYVIVIVTTCLLMVLPFRSPTSTVISNDATYDVLHRQQPRLVTKHVCMSVSILRLDWHQLLTELLNSVNSQSKYSCYCRWCVCVWSIFSATGLDDLMITTCQWLTVQHTAYTFLVVVPRRTIIMSPYCNRAKVTH